ncbi:MAG: S41 family peptidase [Ruminococcaceae bacterium]|nr:S41 family peptidase [Oscillospiraceae bacterium]
MSDKEYNGDSVQSSGEPILSVKTVGAGFPGYNGTGSGGGSGTGKSGVPVVAVVVIVLVAILITFMTTYVLTVASPSPSVDGVPEEAYTKIDQISGILEDEYLYDIDEKTLSDYILKGYMYGIGDNYSEYFTKEEFDALMSDTNAEMVGIGISVVADSNYGGILVISVFPDSPAQKAGVLPGDIITHIKVDGEMVSVQSLGLTVASNAMRGEEGTAAEFIVSRGEGDPETVEFSIERGAITEYTVTYRVHSEDEKIGVIAISSFDKETPNQFKTAYDELLAKGCEKLVIDVRNNPGGELVSVCVTLDMLVPEGPVIRTVDKKGNEEVVYNSDKDETNVPIAVLVNGNTASAGELFAAALRDYEKAVLVGETTFGKGSMQTTMSFSDGTAFKYTYRYYCPPFSDNYDGVGLTPDVKAELSEEALSHFFTMTDAEDTQLKAAVDELNK